MMMVKKIGIGTMAHLRIGANETPEKNLRKIRRGLRNDKARIARAAAKRERRLLRNAGKVSAP